MLKIGWLRQDLANKLLKSAHNRFSMMYYPKPGVLFKYMIPVFNNYPALELLIQQSINTLKKKLDINKIDYFVGLQSRGYQLASILAFTWKKQIKFP